MRRSRVFRLGRRAVTTWRRVLHPRPKRYLRLLDLISPRSKSPLFCTPITMMKSFFDWGRCCLTGRRLQRPSLHSNETHYDSGAVPLLEQESVPPPPPKGHMVVYVGGWKGGVGPPPRRYLVPVIYFNHPLFGELLREAEAEFGYHHPGGITIPCPVARFEHVQTRIADAGGACRRIARPQFSLGTHHP